ncbi:MAG: YCF48-related protein, partial [Saprospiraceae bacterium]
LLKTIDGGDSWNPVSQFPFEAPANWIRSIKFVNNNVGFACADIGRIYKTEDGGDTWVRLNSPTQEALFDVDFIDEKNGMICGFTGTILQTIDGGEHWQKIQSPLGLENLYSIDYVNANEAYICTHFGKILKLEKINNLAEWSLSEVKIFPNPVQDNLHLELEEKITSEIKYLSLENVQGQVLFHSPVDEGKINICLSNLSSGIYLLKFFNDENILMISKKMIKQ